MDHPIRQARRRAGLGFRACARTLNVDPSTLSSWETGRRRPNAPNIMALADLFGVNPRDLLMCPSYEPSVQSAAIDPVV